jgi:hypothetical protein
MIRVRLPIFIVAVVVGDVTTFRLVTDVRLLADVVRALPAPDGLIAWIGRVREGWSSQTQTTLWRHTGRTGRHTPRDFSLQPVTRPDPQHMADRVRHDVLPRDHSAGADRRADPAPGVRAGTDRYVLRRSASPLIIARRLIKRLPEQTATTRRPELSLADVLAYVWRAAQAAEAAVLGRFRTRVAAAASAAPARRLQPSGVRFAPRARS